MKEGKKRERGREKASSLGPFEKSEKRAWYPLFAHALNFLTFQEFPDNTVLPPCDMTSVCIFCRIFSRTLLTMAICVQGLDSAALYAFL